MPVVTHHVSYPLLSGGIHEVRQQSIKSGEHGGHHTFDLVCHECVQLVLVLELCC